MTVTTERPAFETERTWSSRGSPRMAVSTGKVTNRSTSGGDIPGEVDRTSTWMLVTSGKASMGRRRMDQAPSPIRMATPTRTRARLRREPSMRRSTRPMLIPHQSAFAELGSQQEATRGHDGLPFLEALEDLDEAVGPLSGLDGAAGERPFGRHDEDDPVALVVLNGLFRHNQGSATGPG